MTEAAFTRQGIVDKSFKVRFVPASPPDVRRGSASPYKYPEGLG
jgi:hypothetical protein